MPRPRPLRPEEARRTLAHRFGRRADNLRQLATKFGVRPYRVFLVWTRWDGGQRGRGNESIVSRIELLPTPRVKNLDAVAYRFFSGGVLPVGSISVDRISTNHTQDQLTGLAVPRNLEEGKDFSRPTAKTAMKLRRPSVETLPEPLDFFWEVVEDGRGDDPAERNKFRLAAWPERAPGSVEWRVLLERVSNDENRDGSMNSGFDPAT